MELDLLVIGSGPSGQKAAIQAAKLGKRVAVAERRERLGGVSIHTGTIPSKTLREAVLEQVAQRPLDVLDPTRVEESEQRTLEQLMDRTARVVAAETSVVREQFRRNRVGLLPGQAHFEDANTVRIEDSPEVYAEADFMATVDLVMQCMTMSTILAETAYTPSSTLTSGPDTEAGTRVTATPTTSAKNMSCSMFGSSLAVAGCGGGAGVTPVTASIGFAGTIALTTSISGVLPLPSA